MITPMTTGRLLLREYNEADVDDYFRLKSDQETMYYLQDIQLFSKEEAMIDLAKVIMDRKSADRKFYFFHVELKDTREQIGSVGYTVVENTPVGKLVHAGYFIYPEFWNKGYVTEAFQKVLEYAFTENDVYSVRTGCLSDNIASEKVMIKCGLIKEAEHLDWEWHDGKMKSRVEYRLRKKEWQEQQ